MQIINRKRFWQTASSLAANTKLRSAGMALQNAMELYRLGHLAKPYSAPYSVVAEFRIFRLRRYDARATQSPDPSLAPILLVPPLMLSSEIYDVAPDASFAATMVDHGLDVWVVDFGEPANQPGGMSRTFDDHVRAVVEAVDEVRRRTERDVHLAGYSQGGMFAYQAAAMRKSEGIESVITLGAPVDIHATIDGVSPAAMARAFGAISSVARGRMERMEGISGTLLGKGVRLFSVKKEASQLLDFVRKLADRQALEKSETRRRFLAGEGFTAWPGPALRQFFDDFIVHNRMISGGFVIDGQTVTLSDITCPVLYFLGTRDALARPRAVRAINSVLTDAEVFEVQVKSGHIGLVVGPIASEKTCPTIAEWVRWQANEGRRPTSLPRHTAEPQPKAAAKDEFDFDVQFDVKLAVDSVGDAVGNAFARLGEVSRDVGDAFDSLRYQLPRLSTLEKIEKTTRISFGKSLSDQALAIGDETFFLWQGRALSYADTDQRVGYVVRGLIQCGVREGQRVGVIMGSRPSYLSAVAALNRIGAVAVLLGPEMGRVSHARALEMVPCEYVITDPERAESTRALVDVDVLVLGGGAEERSLAAGITDLEAIDPEEVKLPDWYKPDPGRAADLAMIIFTAGNDDEPRSARITNRRWAFSAYGTAAAATLTPKDTVYCSMPLHHAAGMLVSVGGALVGGARLALAECFEPELFWHDVRRYGVTVAFYAGEMMRGLTLAPRTKSDSKNSLRLFAGSGMRADVWRRLVERFGPVGVLEFYASTEGNAVLANASGEKLGSLGRPLPGSTDMVVARYDFGAREFIRRDNGRFIRCQVDEPGMMIARVDETHPSSAFDGYTEESATEGRIRRGVFEDDDVWFVSGDILRRDEDGDYWFVDRESDVVISEDGVNFSVEVEDALYELPSVARAVVYGVSVDGIPAHVLVANVVPKSGEHLEPAELTVALAARLPVDKWPKVVHVVHSIDLSDGYRSVKSPLRAGGLGTPGQGTLCLDAEQKTYGAVQADDYDETVRRSVSVSVQAAVVH
ncbi:MAG: alpha/beta fold hydrolase [Polyangiaceae bacterium]|nr:alpha/beta fold hydrolase [Polyangiaceae bacterium]